MVKKKRVNFKMKRNSVCLKLCDWEINLYGSLGSYCHAKSFCSLILNKKLLFRYLECSWFSLKIYLFKTSLTSPDWPWTQYGLGWPWNQKDLCASTQATSACLICIRVVVEPEYSGLKRPEEDIRAGVSGCYQLPSTGGARNPTQVLYKSSKSS